MEVRKNIITDDVLLFHPLLEGYDVDIVFVPSRHLLHQVPLDWRVFCSQILWLQ